MSHMMHDLGRTAAGRPRALLRAVKQEFEEAIHRPQPLTDEDDAEIIRAFDEARGYHLSRAERSERASKFTVGAPLIRVSGGRALPGDQ